MQESTARTIHALIYPGGCIRKGVFVFRSGKQGRGLAWQAFGLASILVFTVFALFALPWVDGLLSAALLLAESVLIFRFWRVREHPEESRASHGEQA
jgi:hypothetical protein